jgi:hypothetical protein
MVSHNLSRMLATLILIITVSIPNLFFPTARLPEYQSSTATVSGVIRHSGNPVSGVQVSVIWSSGSQKVTTGSGGTYSVSGVPTGGQVQIFVRPPVSLRLAYHNWEVDDLTGDLSQDFNLEDGYRLQGELHKPDGTLYTQSIWMNPYPLDTSLPTGEWSGDNVASGQFDMVLPTSRYLLDLSSQPSPYYLPRITADLRSNDITGLVITLLNDRPPALPTVPPDANRITVGGADINGIAAVTGSAGTVEPLSDVVIVNLNAHSMAHTIADANGGFSSSVFAPPGSTLMVKYDPDGWRTIALLSEVATATGTVTYLEFNPLPGTMVNVGAPPASNSEVQDFTASGGFIEGPSTTSHGKWAGWWLSGRVVAHSGPPLQAYPGQSVTLQNLVLHVASPAFNCSGQLSITVSMHIFLRYLFAQDGRPYPWSIWFTSFLSTPTGLPIEHEAYGESVNLQTINFTAFACDGAHAAVSMPSQTIFTLPADLPEGMYLIRAVLGTSDVTQADVADAPFVSVWYHDADEASLPILTVGDVQSPHIPWTLLGDYPVDGRRGVGAREDAGVYTMPDRVITPPERYILPRLDPRTNAPLVYRLEPGSHWLSATDRRFPTPPHVPLRPETGHLMVTIQKPDGSSTTLGPAAFRQTSQRTPATESGSGIAEGTGQISDLYHLTTRDSAFDYSFDQYGHHIIILNGSVQDIYGRTYSINGTYDVYVARVLDLDPAELPTTPYMQGDAFAPGLHLFPPVPADVTVGVVQMPYSDPNHAFTNIISGKANEFGYFQPPVGTEIRFTRPGEFRVDINAVYTDSNGTLWTGSLTWGSVVEGTNAQIEAHGRRGMDYQSDTIDDMPAWFEVFNLPASKVGIENYYPYFSGDIHWGNEDKTPGDSIHSIITVKDLTPSGKIYNTMLADYPRSRNGFRWPPNDTSLVGLQKRLDVGEAPLFLSTSTGHDAAVYPQEIDQWAYWYGSSERPDVHVREIISEDNMGTAYWRFNDTYNMQIGEGANGDLPGDLKWEFGGAVFRVPSKEIDEYAIYSSLWVLLPHNDSVGARVTPPFQDATGAGINGGPIMKLKGQDIDMLFLPKGVRPGDVLEVGDTISFSGHVGPPLDSRVTVTITSPSGVPHSRQWHANKIGWLYDPTFDFIANEPGRWTVDVAVLHDRPYVGNGVIPMSHNTGTVLGTSGRYEFYVIEPGSPRLAITAPNPGYITWPAGNIEPITIHGITPAGTTAVHFTIHDKGVVMGQGTITPNASGAFDLIYDAKMLNQTFPMLSLTAHEGQWEGLSDEVAINLLALTPSGPRATTVTLIGEEVFVKAGEIPRSGIYLPVVIR